jgi:ribose 5-phosphate isomerase A
MRAHRLAERSHTGTARPSAAVRPPAARPPRAPRRTSAARATPPGDDDNASPPPGLSSKQQPSLDDPATWASRRAAEAAIDRFVLDAGAPVRTIGVGAGEEAHHIIAALAAAAGAGRLDAGVAVAAAGAPAVAEAALAGLPALPTTGAAAFPVTDVFFVPAAGVDTSTRPRFAYVTGGGGPPESAGPQPALAETLAGARAAKKVVALVGPAAAAAGGAAGRLGPGLDMPVLVRVGGSGDGDDGDADGLATWEAAAEELDDAFLGDAEIWRRPASGPSGSGGANPRGGSAPYLTPDGAATLLDVRWATPLRLVDDEACPYEDILAAVEAVPGFLEAGLVSASAGGAADAVVVAGAGPGGAPVVVEAQAEA